MTLRWHYPWLKSASFDLPWILLPPLLSVLGALLFARSFDQTSDVPLWAWLVFILGIDVSHVYSTLFRTYLNTVEFQENKILLTVIPIGVWLVGVILYSVGPLVFWRVLAYVAVFHFIRQQYGFVRLYARGEKESAWDRRLTGAAVYLAAVYPVVYWHAHQPRQFHWFVDGDFFQGLPQAVSTLMGAVYAIVLGAWFIHEVARLRSGHSVNVPKNLVIVGTAVSWYTGIVYFNGDMIFTITNVVSHGIPYMALVWVYGQKQTRSPQTPRLWGRVPFTVFFSRYSAPVFLVILLMLGYLEEGLWAGFIWREHLSAFPVFSSLPAIVAKDTLSWLIPLLTLPQATHYVLDGFIWRMKDSGANWQKVLFNRNLGVDSI